MTTLTQIGNLSLSMLVQVALSIFLTDIGSDQRDRLQGE